MTKMYRKLWLWFNKKPQPKWCSYFDIMIMPFLLGISLGATILYTGVEGLPPTAIMLLILVIGSITISDAYISARRGYYDAIHNHYLARREKVMKEMEEDKPKIEGIEIDK